MKYGRKLGAYFGLLILASVWTVHTAYVVSEAVTDNYRHVGKSEARIVSIREIIENLDAYQERAEKDGELKIVMTKALE